MENKGWSSPLTLPHLLAASSPDPRQLEWRVQVIERDLALPIKAVALSIMFYYLFMYHWMADMNLSRSMAAQDFNRNFAQEVVQMGFLVYAALNIGVAFILRGMQQLTPLMVQSTVFSIALIDGLYLGAMVAITGGIDSNLYWLYMLLIVRNSVSVAAAGPQVVLNLLMCLFYGAAVLIDRMIQEADSTVLRSAETELPLDLGKPFLLRILLMVAVAAWCYSMQLLLDKQRRNMEEQYELDLRRRQQEASGRLAAEIAHQLKNPLAIINNAAFTLRRTVKEGKTITQQIQIIREEVERSDRIITELMGYTQLVEGRVEKLNVVEELERAILRVFPPAVKYETQIHRDFSPELPHLLAQRDHFVEIFVNLMQNAREVMNGSGNIWVKATYGDNHSILISVEDDGPGIPEQFREKIFEPYFSTRDKGTGLGLVIVKHNAEIYGGKVRVESELGKGSRFIVQFPARTLMKLKK